MKMKKQNNKRIALIALSALLISGCKNKNLNCNKTFENKEEIINTEEMTNPFDNLMNRLEGLNYDDVSKDIVKNIAFYTESDEIPIYIKYLLDSETYDRDFYLSELIKQATYDYQNESSYHINSLKIMKKSEEDVDLLKYCITYGKYSLYQMGDNKRAYCVVTDSENNVLLITEDYDVKRISDLKLKSFYDYLKENNLNIQDFYSYEEVEFFSQLLNSEERSI